MGSLTDHHNAMILKAETNPNKGVAGGDCNRTQCQSPGAIYFNHSTRKYYCHACALDLNEANRLDAIRLFGHNLCTKDEEAVKILLGVK